MTAKSRYDRGQRVLCSSIFLYFYTFSEVHRSVHFQIGPEDNVPKETQWLYNNWDHTVRCRDGSIEGWEWDYLAPTFLVEPGRYCGILYNEKPGGSNTAFCIMVYSAVPLQIK